LVEENAFQNRVLERMARFRRIDVRFGVTRAQAGGLSVIDPRMAA
jgi:hypothetical protein